MISISGERQRLVVDLSECNDVTKKKDGPCALIHRIPDVPCQKNATEPTERESG